MSDKPNNTKRQLIVGLAALIVIAAIVTTASLSAKKDPVSAADTTSTSQTTTSSSNNTTYKDGTYSATSDFSTPGGQDSMDLNVTIKNNVVSSTSVTTNAPDSESEEFDGQFVSAYKSDVVGKNISQINVSRLAGASLTTQAFNDALQKIARQAQA